jgi:hypothetical protein
VNTKKLLYVLGLMFLFLAYGETLWAQNASYNRPNPTMDYVPQEIGIYDTMYDHQTANGCRKCHGNSLADRHHGLPIVVKDHKCLTCHPICTVGNPNCENGITIKRNCLAIGCHSPADVQFGNGAGHHNTDMAQSENCIACHDPNLIEEITPFRSHEMYPPTVITPTPFSCENCHYPQGLVAGTTPPDGDTPGHPSTYDHYDLWGNCVGFAEYGKPISGNMDTHHMDLIGSVATECYKCHSQDPDDPSWDPNNPELMRYCMICHSMRTLHSIGPHVSPHPGWLPVGFHANPGDPIVPGGGGPGPNPVDYATWDYNPCGPNPNPPFPYAPQVTPGYTADRQCFGCHGGDVPPWEPGNIGQDPVIDTDPVLGMQPTAGSCGAIVTLRGDYFGSEHIDGRSVEFAPRIANPSAPPAYICDWANSTTTLPIHAWTDTMIEWELPCWKYAPGLYCVRVRTEEGVSPRRVFMVEGTPTALEIDDGVGDPDSGPCGGWLTISGSGGFGTRQSKMYSDGYHGRHVIVDFVASTGEYTATNYKTSALSWTDTSIQVQLYDLFQDLTDTCSIDPLTGQLRMNRNFVQDVGDEGDVDTTVTCDNNLEVPSQVGFDECAAEPTILRCDCLSIGTFNVYVKAIYFGDDDASGDLSCGDTIFEVEKSDAVQYELTNAPIINKLNPKRVVDPVAAPWPLLRIYGGNFGPTQGDGEVRIGTEAQAVSDTLGLGRELTRIVLWSDTLIKVRVQVPDTWRGTTKYVWVEKGGLKSVYKPLAILAPLP